MVSPCNSLVAATAQKIALVVPSGGEVNNLLSSVLAIEGWSIQYAVDNQQALARAVTEPFDLIITARKALGSEDVELLRKIRSSRPHVRLIILTDKFTPGDVISAMREGAFSYFSAPFQASELADMLHAAMAAPCWDDGIEVLSGTTAWVRLAARCEWPRQIAWSNSFVESKTPAFPRLIGKPSLPLSEKFSSTPLSTVGISTRAIMLRFRSSACVVRLYAASKTLVRDFRWKSSATRPSAVRPTILSATWPFAKLKVSVQVASGFCWQKNWSTNSFTANVATTCCW